ncbi:MAG: hypothetical protein HY365_03390 [Candidatus Aenigmarchaeota archaeon]|nr:hypothetical protein [Candidatus Aenigmarchaeota archaeon]
MGEEEMKAGILGEAAQQAEKIRKDAQSERDGIISAARADAEREKERMKRESGESALRLEARELASSRISAKKDVAEEKKEAVNRVYSVFFSRLEKELGREELLRLLFNAGKTQLKSVQKVRVAKEDVPAARGLGVDAVPAAIEGGIIIEGGNESVDLSMDTIRETLKQRTLRSVSCKLFGD